MPSTITGQNPNDNLGLIVKPKIAQHKLSSLKVLDEAIKLQLENLDTSVTSSFIELIARSVLAFPKDQGGHAKCQFDCFRAKNKFK